MSGATVLIVEPSTELRSRVCQALESNGFRTVSGAGLRDGQRLIDMNRPDVVLVAWDLEDGDGLQFIGSAPRCVVMAEANRAPQKLVALRRGADEILFSPVDIEELVLRLNKLMAPTRVASNLIVELGEISVHAPSRALVRPDGSFGDSLTETEMNLLRVFAANVGLLVSRDDCNAAAFAEPVDGATRALDAATSRLRNKIRKAQLPFALVSVRSEGYILLRRPDMAIGKEMAIAK